MEHTQMAALWCGGLQRSLAISLGSLSSPVAEHSVVLEGRHPVRQTSLPTWQGALAYDEGTEWFGIRDALKQGIFHELIVFPHRPLVVCSVTLSVCDVLLCVPVTLS